MSQPSEVKNDTDFSCPVDDRDGSQEQDILETPLNEPKPDPREESCKQEGKLSLNYNEETDARLNVEPKTSTPTDDIDSTQPSDATKSNLNSNLVAISDSYKTSLENQLQKAKRDLECMVLKYAKSERENLLNKQKSEDLDKKLKRTIKDNDQLANRIKLLTNDKNQLTDTLSAKVAHLTVLEQKYNQLNNVQGVKLKDYEEKIKKLEITNEEYSTLIDSYKSKEGELLDFSERLSMKHMMLQSELDEALKKVPNFKDEYESSSKKVDELMQERDTLERKLQELNSKLEAEERAHEKLRMDTEAERSIYRSELDKSENELKVARRKHQIVNKELLKEIKLLKSQLTASAENFKPDTRTMLDNNKGELATKNSTLVT